MLTTLKLFRLDFFQISPQQHDALCREEERKIRDAGLFDHLDFEVRSLAIKAAVQEKCSWAARRAGWVQTELRNGRFYADLHVTNEGAYRESFELGTLADNPEDLRTAFLNLPSRMAELLQATAFIDVEPYHILVERFDFKRFCNDHRLPHPEKVAERARTWN
jgi:hypothetical protein